jgi:hypothetical protein
MFRRRKVAVWALVIVGFASVSAAAYYGYRLKRKHSLPITLKGAVVKQDYDPRKQSPIANVEVIFRSAFDTQDTRSDFSGGFTLPMPPRVKLGQPIRLSFRHPDFQPLELDVTFSHELYVVRMTPLHGEVEAKLNEAEIGVTNVLVRYSTETTRTEPAGYGVKTFQVQNLGNVPCDQKPPCSPDGRWRAGVATASLDAGQGNTFRDARVTCIAGPCPFTRIDQDSFSRGGRTISVSVRGWSDTATFLLQAEVFRSQLQNIVHRMYPVIFGRSLNFTLPSNAEGPSLQADIGGTQIVFPMGPAPALSWATCRVREERNQAKDYRCELMPGYEFR